LSNTRNGSSRWKNAIKAGKGGTGGSHTAFNDLLNSARRAARLAAAGEVAPEPFRRAELSLEQQQAERNREHAYALEEAAENARAAQNSRVAFRQWVASREEAQARRDVWKSSVVEQQERATHQAFMAQAADRQAQLGAFNGDIARGRAASQANLAAARYFAESAARDRNGIPTEALRRVQEQREMTRYQNVVSYEQLAKERSR
jgi:hypothetical protein